MTITEPITLPRKVALIAHDKKKKELITWAKYNAKLLAQTSMVATGTTGSLIEEALQQPVQKFLSGPYGGGQQIGALIAQQEIDLLVFFWDPTEAHPHDPDVKALLRLCQVWNVPVACNLATADYLISSPLFKNDYVHKRPDYDSVMETRMKEPKVKPVPGVSSQVLSSEAL